MKKNYIIFALICFSLFIGGCTKEELETPQPLDTDQVSNNIGEIQSEKVITGKIIETREESFLVADTEDENGLYQVSLDTLKGNTSEISAGDMVEIGFDGLVLEIYPAIIANPDYMVFLEKSEDFVGLYHDIFIDLYETDSGLNSGIDFIAVDLTKDNILTDSEKNALLYLLRNAAQVETRLATYDDLFLENLVSVDRETEFSQIDTGILFIMETSDLEKDSFQFTAEKWRSSLGAYVFYDCTAKKDKGIWGYEIGEEMIS